MNTKTAFMILLLLLLPTATSYSAKTVNTGEVWTVDDDGPADFHTIQEAVDAASNGDAILVHSGIYYEHFTINKSISLIGDSPFDTIIDAGKEIAGSVILIRADNVAVKNLTLRDSLGYPDFRDGGGVCLYQSNGCTVENCILFNNSNGINLCGSSDNKIFHNLVEGRNVGITIESSSAYPYLHPGNNLIIGNWILNHTRHGMYVGMHAHNNTVTENIFSNSARASLYIYSPTSGVVYGNDFVSDLSLYVDAQMETGVDFNWSKNGVGNFWMNYTGADADEDGIGDTPYLIQYLSGLANASIPLYESAYDDYPLMKPINWLQGDINYDTVVNIIDIAMIAKTYGSHSGDADWNPRYDLSNDNNINILDIAAAAANFDIQMRWQPA